MKNKNKSLLIRPCATQTLHPEFIIPTLSAILTLAWDLKSFYVDEND